MEKNEVLWDFLAEKLSGQQQMTTSSSTYAAYEASLNEFAERTKTTDKLQAVREYMADFMRSIESSSSAEETGSLTVKEAIFALCAKCDEAFLASDENYLLFLDLVQILFAKPTFDKNKKLFFNSLETVFYYLQKYIGQVIRSLSFLSSKPDEDSSHEEMHHAPGAEHLNKKKRKLTPTEAGELGRLLALLTRVIDLVEFLYKRQLTIEQLDTSSSECSSYKLQPLLSSFLLNLYYEPLLFIDNNDDHDPDDHMGNKLFEQVVSLIMTTCQLLMRINKCADIVKLVVGQFEAIEKKPPRPVGQENEEEEKIERDWTTSARYQLKGPAVSAFFYLLLKMNHFEINKSSDPTLTFAFPEIYSFDYMFKRLYAPCLKHLFESKSGLADDHLIKNRSQVNNVLEFLNQIIIVEQGHGHHEHDDHGHCQHHHHHHDPKAMPTMAVTIDSQVELDYLIGVFEKLFGLTVYENHASVRHNLYHLINNLFTLKLDPKLKNSLITCYLYKTCRTSNGSGLSQEYLKLTNDSTSSCPKKLFDEQSQQHLYSNDAFNTYLASFMIYQFKEHFNKEFQSIIKSDEPTGTMIYLERTNGDSYKLTSEFMRPFNLIFDVNYLRVDIDTFVNEILLKSEMLIKQESKFVAQLNLLRYLFILVANEKVRDKVNIQPLKDSLASTKYLKYVEAGLEKVKVNMELEKADLGRQQQQTSKPKKVDFKVKGLGETQVPEDDIKMKQQSIDSSLRSLDLMQSLKSRIDELLAAL